jgi:hypothetical protein
MSQKTALLVGAFLVIMLAVLGFVAGSGAQAMQDPTPTPLPDPVLGDLDLDAIAQIDLASFPLVPEISENAKRIYADGLARGNNPNTFAKVGDCMTFNPYFLEPIGGGDYELGEYQDLQTVIDTFSQGEPNSFARQSQASAGGFNSASVLDSMWANPEFCEAGETPLQCEFRVMKPNIALIMFGTNDVFYLDEASFDYFMRSIVVETIRNGTLPVLSTFPHRPEFPEKSVLFNQIVAQIAQDYDIPLINLWLALDPLPNHGVDEVDTTHMTVPASGGVIVLTDANLESAGFTVRNLLTLQALDAVLKAVGEQ